MQFLKLVGDFTRDLYENRYTIYQLTKRDYKNRYIGSFLGFVWTIIQPIVMIFVLWIVFVKGFKSGPVHGNIPYIAYLSIGMIVWHFFSEALMACTNVFQEYSYLVKKINFKIAILPTIKLSSGLITHAIFILIGMVILLFSGIQPSWYWLQFPYYLMGLIILLLGISWITSSLQVFIRDISQIVGITLQFGFWYTPVVWDMSLIPKAYQIYFKINPLYYIIEGYQKSFIYHEPFWGDTKSALLFWLTTLTISLIGAALFKKLRPHFADVL